MTFLKKQTLYCIFIFRELPKLPAPSIRSILRQYYFLLLLCEGLV